MYKFYKFALTIFLFISSHSYSLPPCNGNFDTLCFGTIVHKNGEKYVGEIKNYKYNGNGTYLYQNGNIYEGEFLDGLQNGQGIFTFSNGDRYEESLEMVYIMVGGNLFFPTANIMREIL